VAGADFRAAFVASCFLGALPPVDLRAVCLVRAIWIGEKIEGGKIQLRWDWDLVGECLLEIYKEWRIMRKKRELKTF